MNMTQTIGDSYMTWRKGSYIFIRAGTGTGKTYFVLHILYEYAINQGCTIVLLVNRRILKQQILCDLKKYDAKRKRKRHQIWIFTYQELESSSPDSWQHQCVQDAEYIVCDEAHYFLADSTFNPGTIKSFDLIMELLPDKITIFMTATPTKIMPVIQEKVANDYEKRRADWDEAEAKRKQRNEKIRYESCYYREDGTECDLLEFAENLQAYEGSYREMQETLEPSPEPIKPEFIEYSLSQSLDDNLIPHFFNGMDDLKAAITGNSFKGKWVVFVSSKWVGEELRTELEMHFQGNKKIVFVDADYELKGHEAAMDEVSEIVQRGRLAADILICTSVLDNGISIHDPNLCHMVLMADDEVEFIQMLGRKRLSSKSEKIHLFLPTGKPAYFQRREKHYFDQYRRLCKHLQFNAVDVFTLLETNSLSFQDMENCYNHEDDIFYVSQLAIEEIRLRYIFCSEMSEKLRNDDNAFMREQLRWMNLEYSETLYLTQKVQYSQEAVDQITSCLTNIHKQEGGLISKTKFDELKKTILEVASTTDASYQNKSGSPATINKILQSLPDWNPYQFSSIILGKTYYELLFENQNCIGIDGDKVTLDFFKQTIAQCQDIITEDCFKSITNCFIPACLADDNSKVVALLNEKMKSVEHLKDYIVKNQSGSRPRIILRPKK